MLLRFLNVVFALLVRKKTLTSLNVAGFFFQLLIPNVKGKNTGYF